MSTARRRIITQGHRKGSSRRARANHESFETEQHKPHLTAHHEGDGMQFAQNEMYVNQHISHGFPLNAHLNPWFAEKKNFGAAGSSYHHASHTANAAPTFEPQSNLNHGPARRSKANETASNVVRKIASLEHTANEARTGNLDAAPSFGANAALLQRIAELEAKVEACIKSARRARAKVVANTISYADIGDVDIDNLFTSAKSCAIAAPQILCVLDDVETLTSPSGDLYNFVLTESVDATSGQRSSSWVLASQKRAQSPFATAYLQNFSCVL